MSHEEITHIKREWRRKRALILNRFQLFAQYPQSKDFSEYNDILALADQVEDSAPDLATKMQDDLTHLTEIFKQWLKVYFPLPHTERHS